VPRESPADRAAALTGARLSELIAERSRRFGAKFARKFGAPGSTPVAWPPGTQGSLNPGLLAEILGALSSYAGALRVRVPEGDKGRLAGRARRQCEAAERGAGLVRFPYACGDVDAGLNMERVPVAVEGEPVAVFGPVADRAARPFASPGASVDALPALARWDPEVALDVVAHWADAMTAEGWLALDYPLTLAQRLAVGNVPGVSQPFPNPADDAGHKFYRLCKLPLDEADRWESGVHAVLAAAGLPGEGLRAILEERGRLAGQHIIPDDWASRVNVMVGEQLEAQAGSSHKDIRIEL